MKKRVIYVDTASTTQVYKEAISAMNEFHLENFGNPGSTHAFGETARRAMEETKKKLAKEIHANPWELIFTSGGTESNNLAL